MENEEARGKRKMKEVYYKCPICKDITTEKEILEEASSGGMGMCYCQFDNGRILIKWKKITKNEYNKLKKKELK